MLSLRLGVAVVMAGLGAVAAISFKKVSHRGLCVLISFAAGALLTVAVFDILPESAKLVGWVGGAISAASGYALFWVVTRYVFHICPACAATHTEVNFKAITIAMVVALSLHSFMDGLAIYSGYVTASNVGVMVLMAVAFHKFPEGMALTLVARGSAMSRWQAFCLCVGLEAFTTVAGGFAGLVSMVACYSNWVGYILGHVGGGFIFLVVHALLSEVFKHHPRSTVLAALAGAVSISLAGFLIGVF